MVEPAALPARDAVVDPAGVVEGVGVQRLLAVVDGDVVVLALGAQNQFAATALYFHHAVEKGPDGGIEAQIRVVHAESRVAMGEVGCPVPAAILAVEQGVPRSPILVLRIEPAGVGAVPGAQINVLAFEGQHGLGFRRGPAVAHQTDALHQLPEIQRFQGVGHPGVFIADAHFGEEFAGDL